VIGGVRDREIYRITQRVVEADLIPVIGGLHEAERALETASRRARPGRGSSPITAVSPTEADARFAHGVDRTVLRESR
jgi:hypothetical protein